MNTIFSLEELAGKVQEWCAAYHIAPASGQSAEAISERNIRYYRTCGLIDAPAGPGGRGFTNKHRLQLIAIRVLQAQGLPLRRIRELLYGLSEENLEELESKAVAEIGRRPRRFNWFEDSNVTAQPAFTAEAWTAIPLSAEFLLVNRSARPVAPATLEKIARLLKQTEPNKRQSTPAERPEQG